MPNRTAAERILELVTTPEKARSITGDLLEYASGRQDARFWFAVLRIFASQICLDLYDAPLRMLWLVFSGFIEWVLGGMLFANAVIKLWMAIAPYQGPNWSYIPPWGFFALLLTLITAAPFVVGWEVASRSKGRHLAAGFAIVLAVAALGAVRIAQDGILAYHNETYPFVENRVITCLCESIFVFLGVTIRRLRAGAIDRASMPPMRRLIQLLGAADDSSDGR
jgi:hypothetical protein